MKSVPIPMQKPLRSELESGGSPSLAESEALLVLSETMQDLGLSAPECSVFLCLLRFGTRQAATIAKHSGMSRTHVYEILDRLRTRDLIKIHERDGVKHFSSLPLEELIGRLARKEFDLAERRRQLGEVIQRLPDSKPDFFSEPVTKSFRGPEVRGRLFQELERSNDEHLLAFCSAKAILLFEGSAPTQESLECLRNHVSASCYFVLHSCNIETIEVVQELKDPRLIAIHEAFPADMIVSQSGLSIIGKKAVQPFGLTVEQPAIAQAILLFGLSVLSRLSGSENTYWSKICREKEYENTKNQAA